MMKRWPSLALFLCLAMVLGFGAKVAVGLAEGAWFPELELPSFFFPLWLQTGVTFFLYFMVGLAGWMVWKRVPHFSAVAYPLGVYGTHLLFLGAWPWLFFGLRSPLLGLMDMGLLVIALVANVFSFYRIHRGAATLLLPHLLWTSYVGFLNACVYLLMP